jgi:hypothetical protein
LQALPWKALVTCSMKSEADRCSAPSYGEGNPTLADLIHCRFPQSYHLSAAALSVKLLKITPTPKRGHERRAKIR